MELNSEKQEAERANKEAQADLARELQSKSHQQADEAKQRQNETHQAHLQVLKEMGVDLTTYLTQGRADQVIEVRGDGAKLHLHMTQGGEA